MNLGRSVPKLYEIYYEEMESDPDTSGELVHPEKIEAWNRPVRLMALLTAIEKYTDERIEKAIEAYDERTVY